MLQSKPLALGIQIVREWCLGVQSLPKCVRKKSSGGCQQQSQDGSIKRMYIYLTGRCSSVNNGKLYHCTVNISVPWMIWELLASQHEDSQASRHLHSEPSASLLPWLVFHGRDRGVGVGSFLLGKKIYHVTHWSQEGFFWQEAFGKNDRICL